MNTKSLLLFLIGVVSGILFLSSCSDEEEVWDPREHSGWGVFKGTVNGENVSIENNVHNRYLNCTPQREVWDPNIIKGISIGMVLNDSDHLGISLYRLTEGMRFVTKNYDPEYNSDAIQFWRTVIPKDSYSYDVLYSPKKDKPFKIKITELTYYDNSAFVRVTAQLDGVLYSDDNPQQDSVVIKAVFGVR